MTIDASATVEFEFGIATYTGPTHINGTLVLEAGDALPPSSAMVLGSSGMILFNSEGVSGLNYSMASLSGSGSLLIDSSKSILDVGTDNTNTTFTGSIGGTGMYAGYPYGNLVKVGTGVLTLSGSSTFDGTITVDSGAISVAGSASSLGASSNSVFLGNTSGSANASLLVAGAFTLNNPITVQSGSTGTLMIGGSTASSSTVAGQITLNQGVTLTQVAGGTLNVTGGILAFGNSISTTGAGNITIGTNGIVGSGAALNVNGTGVVTLSAGLTESYGGPTNVNAGTLDVNGTLDTESSMVNVNAGGVLTGTGIIDRATIVAPGGHLDPGNGVGTLTIDDLTLSPSSILDYEFNSSQNDFTAVTVGNGLTIDGGGFNLYQAGTTIPFDTVGTYHLIGYAGNLEGTGTSSLSALDPQGGLKYNFTNDVALHDIDLSITAVPEPSSLILLAIGGLALAGLSIPRRSTSKADHEGTTHDPH